MKKTDHIQLLLGATLMLASCTNKKATSDFVAPSSKEIYDVVNTLVMTEKLQDPIMDRKTFVMAKLAKQKVNFEGRIGEYANYVDMLAQKGIFSKTDSSFFVYQNSILPSFVLTDTPIKVTSESEKKEQKVDSWRNPVIVITLPVFSLDHNKAYVQVAINNADAGHGEEYFLVKENGIWRIKFKQMMWVA